MKIISKLILVLLILLQPASLYVGDPKVMVTLFEGKDPDKGPGQENGDNLLRRGYRVKWF